MSRTTKLYVISGILMAMISCKKEKIVEMQFSWKQSEEFLYDEKIQLNGFATSDNLYTIGPASFTALAASDDSTKFGAVHSAIEFEYPIGYKLPITSKIFVGCNTTGVGFYSARNPVMGDTYQWIFMMKFDSTFTWFDFPRYWSSEAMSINNKNQCLIPYCFYSTYGGSRAVDLEPRFIVADLKVTGSYEDIIDTISCHRIQYSGMVGHPIALFTFDDYFIVTGSTHTIRISSDLNISKIYDGRLYKIVKSNNDLYGFSEDKLLKSTDKGFSWITICNVDDDYHRLGYSWIQNKLIGYYKSQLFEISITDQGIASKELKTDGLNGNQITSLNLFKGKVMVTTLSGVFAKEIGAFFEYAE